LIRASWPALGVSVIVRPREMPRQIAAKPAAAETADGLQRVDRLGRLMCSIANPTVRLTQGAYRVVRAHWIVVLTNTMVQTDLVLMDKSGGCA
jgi:hypothetical protein